MRRQIATYGNYFLKFYSALDKPAQEKIDYVFELIKTLHLIPKKFFKHMKGAEGLFEIRVEFESNIYRILCFF